MLSPDSNIDIALIGDVHTEHDLLETALKYLRARGAARVLCVGDIVDGPGDVDRCCALLREHGVLAVRGNHERWLLADTMRTLPYANFRSDLAPETVAFLEALPATRPIPTSRGEALLCHGLGPIDMACVRVDDSGYALEVNGELHALIEDPAVRLVFNGHTHRRMVRHFDGLTIVNAGTLHRHDDPGFVLIDLQTGAVSWVSLADPSSLKPAPLGQLR